MLVESKSQYYHMIKKLIPESFVYFKPRDILSGDFYWIEQYPNHVYSSILDVSKPEYIFIGAVDCTGHGVPGALMSIVGNNLLNNAVNEFNFVHPAEILDELNKGLNVTLKQTFNESTVKDGMDIALISIEIATKTLFFSGANNPLYLIRDNKLIVLRGNRFPIGNFEDEIPPKFDEHKMALRKNDVLYIFSDGYADQFGGPKEKKFKYEQFRDLLLEIHNKPMAIQKAILDDTFKAWKGNLDQVDDILVIGFKI